MALVKGIDLSRFKRVLASTAVVAMLAGVAGVSVAQADQPAPKDSYDGIMTFGDTKSAGKYTYTMHLLNNDKFDDAINGDVAFGDIGVDDVTIDLGGNSQVDSYPEDMVGYFGDTFKDMLTGVTVPVTKYLDVKADTFKSLADEGAVYDVLESVYEDVPGLPQEVKDSFKDVVYSAPIALVQNTNGAADALNGVGYNGHRAVLFQNAVFANVGALKGLEDTQPRALSEVREAAPEVPKDVPSTDEQGTPEEGHEMLMTLTETDGPVGACTGIRAGAESLSDAIKYDDLSGEVLFCNAARVDVPVKGQKNWVDNSNSGANLNLRFKNDFDIDTKYAGGTVTRKPIYPEEALPELDQDAPVEQGNLDGAPFAMSKGQDARWNDNGAIDFGTVTVPLATVLGVDLNPWTFQECYRSGIEDVLANFETVADGTLTFNTSEDGENKDVVKGETPDVNVNFHWDGLADDFAASVDNPVVFTNTYNGSAKDAVAADDPEEGDKDDKDASANAGADFAGGELAQTGSSVGAIAVLGGVMLMLAAAFTAVYARKAETSRNL